MKISLPILAVIIISSISCDGMNPCSSLRTERVARTLRTMSSVSIDRDEYDNVTRLQTNVKMGYRVTCTRKGQFGKPKCTFLALDDIWPTDQCELSHTFYRILDEASKREPH